MNKLLLTLAAAWSRFTQKRVKRTMAMSIDAETFQGAILPHNPEARAALRGKYCGIYSIGFGYQTLPSDSSVFASAYNYPLFGVRLSMADYSHAALAGDSRQGNRCGLNAAEQSQPFHNMKKLIFLAAFITAGAYLACGQTDSLPSRWESLGWRVSASGGGDYVIPTNNFLKGYYPGGKAINTSYAAHVSGDFSFNPKSRIGRLYPGLYQGIGIDYRSFEAKGLTGSPVSVYVYQGMPFLRLGSRMSLDYEWQFGAAFGWRHFYNEASAPHNTAVSTPVTAHMNVGLKFRYLLSRHWQLSCGWSATHFSNGNTNQPNQGINMTGLSLGISYIHNHGKPEAPTREMITDEIADRRLYFDILFYAGWRKKRIVRKGFDDSVFKGDFAVNGLRGGPMWRVNRFLACGGLLDFRYDQSALVEPVGPYVPGETITDYTRPSNVLKQLSLGVMASAELTMPIFSVNVALGLNALKPSGERLFYQALTLKASPHPRFYINIGYQLYDFSEPQNLNLGIGVRL